MNQLKTCNADISAEQAVLLQGLSDFCNGKRTGRPEWPVDIKAFASLAESQYLGSLLYSQCRSWEPSLNGGLRRDFSSDVFFSVNRADLLRSIVEAFMAEGIDLICIKGAVIRDCYPVPELRSMGDVDMVIHPEDRDKADRILLQKMGFGRLIDHHDVWTYGIGEFQFEVHTHMFYDPLANDFDYRTYFDHVWEHVHRASVFGIESPNLYVPDESFHFLYLMAHTAKHIINSGAGFRAYLDMAVTVKSWSGSLDWPWIIDELKKLQLFTFTKTCFTLCEYWFDIVMPLEKGPPERAFLEEVTQKTFEDGIFGFDNSENENAASAREIKREEEKGHSYGFGSVKLLLRKLFPPYRDLQLVPWYSFIDGKPWLLPFVWVYRFFYCGIRKLRHSVKLLTEPFTKKKDVVKRQKLMKEWGL